MRLESKQGATGTGAASSNSWSGKNCRNLFDARIRGIHPRFVQADELWTFVHTKAGHLSQDDPQEWGDAYIWMAIDSETKMVLLYLTVKRDAVSAYNFIRDLSERVTGKFQITTDGLRGYVPAIEEYFGAEVDFAQLLKICGSSDGEGPDWYKPSQVTATIAIPITGNPNPRYISTSHIERANLSIRTHLRRFTRAEPWFQQDARTSDCRRASLYGLFQLLSCTSNAPCDSSNGSQDHRSCMDGGRIALFLEP